MLFNTSSKIKSSQAALYNLSKDFWADTNGATSIEYGLIASVLSVVLIAASDALGGDLNNKFTEIANLLSPDASEPPEA